MVDAWSFLRVQRFDDGEGRLDIGNFFGDEEKEV
jgi:hypothetical protein